MMQVKETSWNLQFSIYARFSWTLITAIAENHSKANKPNGILTIF